MLPSDPAQEDAELSSPVQAEGQGVHSIHPPRPTTEASSKKAAERPCGGTARAGKLVGAPGAGVLPMICDVSDTAEGLKGTTHGPTSEPSRDAAAPSRRLLGILGCPDLLNLVAPQHKTVLHAPNNTRATRPHTLIQGAASSVTLSRLTYMSSHSRR